MAINIHLQINFTFTYFIAFTYFPFLEFATSSLLIALAVSFVSIIGCIPFNWIIMIEFPHKIVVNSYHWDIIVVENYCHYSLCFHGDLHLYLCLHDTLYFVFFYFLCLDFYYQNDLTQMSIDHHRLHQCYLFSSLWDIIDTFDLLFSCILYWQLQDLRFHHHFLLIHLYQTIKLMHRY